MPTYRCLATEVQLYTWSPLMRYSTLSNPTNAMTKSLFVANSGSPGNEIQDNEDTPINNNSNDPAGPWKVTRLNEEYFKGHEGIQFLDMDIPFYLIKAGGDLLRNIPSPPAKAIPQNQPNPKHKVIRKDCTASIGSPLPNMGSFGLGSIGNTSNPSTPDMGYPPQIYGSGMPRSVPSGSHLLNLPSLGSSSNYPNPQVKQSNRKAIISKPIAVSSQTIHTPLAAEFSLQMPKILPKPLKVVVKLSEESFLWPLVQAPDTRLDVCINIFYNGQFTHSQVITHSMWSTEDHARTLHYSGRRNGKSHEIPWVLDLAAVHGRKPHMGLTSLERWQKVAEMLMTEADEWIGDESGQRCPTGNYLEILSKKYIPDDLNILPEQGGGSFGVIDVIIVYGRASSFGLASAISSPHRKLLSKSMSENKIPRRVHNNVAKALLANNKVRAPHPGQPKVIPQKRYRGSEPELESKQPDKRQKTHDSESTIEVDTPTAFRTRSRSSMTPLQEVPRVAQRKKVNKTKISLVNSKDQVSETQFSEVRSTPSKDLHALQPTTPESKSPSKKKRMTTYNPKYSNRPQNLRRKNSAGEWETPTKDGWVVETWTKSAKAAKAKQPSPSASRKKGPRRTVIEPVIQSQIPLIRDDGRSGKASNKFGSSAFDAYEQSVHSHRKENARPPVEREKCPKDKIAPVLEKAETTVAHMESPQKILRIKFFQGSKKAKEADSASIDSRTIQTERSSSPAYVPPSGSGKQPPLQSSNDNSTNRVVRPDELACISSSKLDSYTSKDTAADILLSKAAFSTTSEQYDISANSVEAKDFGSSNFVIAGLRNNEHSLQPSLSDAVKPDSRLAIPTRTHVLQTTQKARISEQKAPKFPETEDALVGVIATPVNDKDVTYRIMGREMGDSTILLANNVSGAFLTVSPKDHALINPSELTPTYVTTHPELKKTFITPPNKVRSIENDSTSSNLPVSCKTSRQNRTVGWSEPNSLLASPHKDHVMNSSLDPTIHGMATQPPTQTSQNVISTKSAERSISATAVLEYKPLSDISAAAVLRRTNESTSRDARLSENDTGQNANLATSSTKPRRLSLRSYKCKNSTSPVVNIFDESPASCIDHKTSVGIDAPTNSKRPYHKAPENATALREVPQVVDSESRHPIKRITESHISSGVFDADFSNAALISGPKTRPIQKPASRIKKNQDATANTAIPGRNTLRGRGAKAVPVILDQVTKSSASKKMSPSDVFVQETNKPISRRPKSSLELAAAITTDSNQTIITSMSNSVDPIVKRPVSEYQKSIAVVAQRSTNNNIGFENNRGEVDMALALKELGNTKSGIYKATEDLQSLTTKAHMRTMASNSLPAGDVLIRASKFELSDMLDNKVQVPEGKEHSTPSAMVFKPNQWRPNSVCEGSVLTYADNEDWIGFEKDPVTELIHRAVRPELDGSFKAEGVLMGVRFVVGM